MEIRHVRKCNRGKCGDTKNLQKVTTGKKKDGTIIQYYSCRKCNTERLKAYRQTPNGRVKVNSAVYRSVAKHREKQNARSMLNYHVRVGNVVKPKKCEKCKKQKKLAGHHFNYNEPLRVVWVCRGCHADIHRLLRA